DDEIETSLGDVVELLPKAFDRFHEIARQHKNAGLREQFSRLLFEPLHARADGSETFSGVAIWTVRRWWNRIAAVITHAPAPDPMVKAPGIAIRNVEAEPARTAHCEGRVAATVETQQR